MTRIKRQRTKKGLRFKCIPAFMDRSHRWHPLDRKEIKMVLKETKWGRQTTKMSSFRCLRCGREELEENRATYSNSPADRKWTAKPTPEDTTKELFDVPP